MNQAKTVLIFLVCGLAGGFCFGVLLSSPRLLTFWYIKGDKFLIPTYRYYLAVGVFLLLGLAAAFSICRMTRLISRPPANALLREALSALIVAISAVSIFAIASSMVLEDAIVTWGLSIVAFVLLISIACWILTAKLYYVGFILNLLTLPIWFALLYVAARIVHVPSEWSEFIAYPVYFSLLAASCGFWISASQPANE